MLVLVLVLVIVIVIEGIGQDYAIRMMLADVYGPATALIWLCFSIWSISDVRENRTANLSAMVSLDYDYDDEHEHEHDTRARAREAGFA